MLKTRNTLCCTEPYEDLRQKLWTGLDTLFSYPVRTWSEEKKLKVLLISDEIKKQPNYNEVTRCVITYIKRAMAKRRAMEAKFEKIEKEIRVIERLRERRRRSRMRRTTRENKGTSKCRHNFTKCMCPICPPKPKTDKTKWGRKKEETQNKKTKKQRRERKKKENTRAHTHTH